MINNDFEAEYSFNEDNCNFIKYKSEFLICCKQSDNIICDRRNEQFLLINRFNLEVSGKITNLTLEEGEDYIKLIYSNEEPSEKGVYEYFIYPPECNNISLSFNSYQTVQINFNDLFQRKTNTKYYVMFKSLPSTLSVTAKINDEVINTDLGKVMDKVFESTDLGKTKGGISLLTKDVRSRIDIVEEAFIMALIQHINGDLWK